MNRKKQFFILSILLSLVASVFGQTALAQDYLVEQGIQIKVNISEKGVNRIAIENDRIAQVIGNEDEYFIESDSNLGQIFLTSALKASGEITIRFLTEREKIIDAKLIVGQMDPQTIVFKYKGEEKIGLSNLNVLSDNSTSKTTSITGYITDGFLKNSYEYKSNGSEKEANVQTVIDLIKLVRNNDVIKGDEIRTLNCLKKNSYLKELKLLQAFSYKIKKYNIVKAIIQNKSKHTMNLKEQDFIACMGSISAVALDKDALGPKESNNLYLVGNYGR